VIEVVVGLGLAAFVAAHRSDGWGLAAHDPAMMVALLVYAIGERSSRQRQGVAAPSAFSYVPGVS